MSEISNVLIRIHVSLSKYIYVNLDNIFFYKHVWLNRIDTSYLSILSLILLSLRTSRLSSGGNEFRKAPYFPQYFRTPTRMNDKMTNIITSHIRLYKEEEKEELEGKFTVEKNFTRGKMKSNDSYKDFNQSKMK